MSTSGSPTPPRHAQALRDSVPVGLGAATLPAVIGLIDVVADIRQTPIWPVNVATDGMLILFAAVLASGVLLPWRAVRLLLLVSSAVLSCLLVLLFLMVALVPTALLGIAAIGLELRDARRTRV